MCRRGKDKENVLHEPAFARFEKRTNRVAPHTRFTPGPEIARWSDAWTWTMAMPCACRTILAR